jgi:mannose-6-phosphate isomerase-like protein (cupin superfamily)
MTAIIPWEKLQSDGNTYRFQGGEHGGIPITFFLVLASPGRGPRLHRHPYEEVFVVQQGQATFTNGDNTMAVSGGSIVVAPASIPHKFINSGEEPLQMINIHPSQQEITEWLEG